MSLTACTYETIGRLVRASRTIGALEIDSVCWLGFTTGCLSKDFFSSPALQGEALSAALGCGTLAAG